MIVGWGQTNLSHLYFSRLSLAMSAKLNLFKTPASEQLVSSRSVSTSTGISGCFQPGQAKVGPRPTPFGLKLKRYYSHWDRYYRVIADRENWNWGEWQQVYATSSRVSFWGISFTQYHILVHPCQQTPLKKGNSKMDSSVQDNPAAPPPCQYTLKALLNSVLGK
jgi:hypothetical protein